MASPDTKLALGANPADPGMAAALLGAMSFSWLPILIRGNTFDVVSLNFWRLFGTAVLSLFILYVTGGRLTLNVLRLSVVGGLLYFIDGLAYMSALKTTSIVNVSVIGATAPLFLLWAGHIVFAERITNRAVLCTIVAIVGALLVFVTPQHGRNSMMGNMLAIVAMGTYVGLMVTSRIALRHLTAIQYLAGASTLATLLTLPFAAMSVEPAIVNNTRSWFMTGGLICVGSLAHLTTIYSHRHISLKAISLLGLGSDVIPVVWAWLIFSERLTGWQWIGTVLVIIAVTAILNSKEHAANRD